MKTVKVEKQSRKKSYVSSIMSFSLCVVVKLTQNKHISGKWAVKKRVQKSPNLCNVQKFNAFVLGNNYELGLTIWLSHVSLDISFRTCATLANSGSHTSWKGEVFGYGGVWLFIFDKVYDSDLGKDGGSKSDEFFGKVSKGAGMGQSKNPCYIFWEL